MLKKLVVLAAVLFVSVPLAVADGSWHYVYTQVGRNQKIVERAKKDVGKYVGLNCKEWVRRVVWEASTYEVNIPTTAPNEDGWYWAPHVWVEELWTDIRWAEPGAVIQMNWQGKDSVVVHTAVVTGKGFYSLQLTESNWSPPYGKVVSQRWVTFDEFNAKAPRYTIHYIH